MNWKVEDKRKVLDKIKRIFQIQVPQDWAKLSIDDIKSSELLSSLLIRYHGSLFNCLQDIYKGYLNIFISLLTLERN